MAIDPQSIGIFIGAVITSVGASWGGSKVIEKRKASNTPEPTPAPAFCSEHHKCFEEIKEQLHEGFEIQGRQMTELIGRLSFIEGFNKGRDQ